MSYQRRASPLHSARAGVGCLYCVSLAVAALVLSNPIALTGVAVAVLGAAVGAGVGRDGLRALRFAIPFALVIAAFNAFFTRDGLTVILRLGNLPLLGHTDITLEATVYGAILGLRAVLVVMCASLYTAAVDPDEVLRLLRPLSFRSALTATLATRMVPVLVRDSRRMAEAQRCRPGRPPSRVTLMRAASSGMLDRALDVAAVLEVRGYGAGGRARSVRRPFGRHDLEFIAAAAVVAGLTLAMRTTGAAAFSAYPALSVASGPAALALALALPVAALLPFADRRGIER